MYNIVLETWDETFFSDTAEHAISILQRYPIKVVKFLKYFCDYQGYDCLTVSSYILKLAEKGEPPIECYTKSENFPVTTYNSLSNDIKQAWRAWGPYLTEL